MRPSGAVSLYLAVLAAERWSGENGGHQRSARFAPAKYPDCELTAKRNPSSWYISTMSRIARKVLSPYSSPQESIIPLCDPKALSSDRALLRAA